MNVVEPRLRAAADRRELRLGVDIGGTFTDIVLIDRTGLIGDCKVLSSPDDPIRAVIEGVEQVLRLSGADPQAVRDVVHGTTRVTNALIEQKGAPTAVIATRGFRDVIEIGREWRYDMYDIFLDAPPRLFSRADAFEVTERTGANGEIVLAVDGGEVDAIVDSLPDHIQSVAVCLLHSYANPTNETRIVERIAARAGHLHVTASSDVAPEVREYERFSTAVANAYVRPVAEPYLRSLEERLAGSGVDGNVYILLSNGGVATVQVASRYPIRITESGPAAGALGAAFLGRKTRNARLLAFDMGGTTAKTCFIDDGRPHITREFEVARAYRFKPGSGIPLKVPAVDLLEIGAGGGSIASVDSLGLLRVGPESSGAQPGPVCYGQGGTEPTVSDADLTLGYLDPDYFLGGNLKLDAKGAAAAIARLAGEVGLPPLEAAWGIHSVVNENMANALRVHSAERAKDPRKYTMLAFGGAGAVHACRVADAIGITRVISPLRASVLSALGMLTAPISFDFVRTDRQQLDAMNWDRVNRLYDDMEREGQALLEASGVDIADVRSTRSGDVRFLGQGYDINIPIPDGKLTEAHLATLHAEFEKNYRALFGRFPANVGVQILNWRLQLSGKDPGIQIRPKRGRAGTAGAPAAKGRRPVYFPETGQIETPVYDRSALRPTDELKGPAIIEEPDTTVVVPPGWAVAVDPYLSITLTKKA